MGNNTYKQNFDITKGVREKRNGHKSLLIWYTGLSGSGKSTLANAVEQELYNKGYNSYTLDGDNIRRGINNDLGFNQEDRLENIRRVAEISKLMMDAGIIVNAAFISPLISDRNIIKDIVGVKNIFEIYVSTSLEECEKRDVKGLYEKARKGLIKDFTGITSKYVPPKNPDVVIDTQDKDISVCVNEILPKIISKIKLDA
jgi:adenylylsulfate kinase